jgi:hypothetical protein
MGFLQKIHLFIRYKKGIQNKFVDMLSIPFVNASIVLQHSSLPHESYNEQYAIDANFKDVHETLTHGFIVEELYYHVHNNLLCHLGKSCIP